MLSPIIIIWRADLPIFIKCLCLECHLDNTKLNYKRVGTVRNNNSVLTPQRRLICMVTRHHSRLGKCSNVWLYLATLPLNHNVFRPVNILTVIADM
ncbi:hypothetical protein C0J52_02896 [Blattella germanica]|nr:hypothetical protein C0J52_02896 [Blattella germanica]